MSTNQDSETEDEFGGEESTKQPENPDRTESIKQPENQGRMKGKGLYQKGAAKTDKDADLKTRDKKKVGCIRDAVKCGDFFLVALILFATAAGINAIANGDVLFTLLSGVVLILAMSARVIANFLGYWQVISGVALAMLSAIFLYAGFYAFSLPRDESWSAWPNIIFSSVLAVAALAAVIYWLSHEDKK